MKKDQPLKILLCAVEPSGDALGASLMASLRKHSSSEIEFIGCGGPKMLEAGLTTSFDVDAFAVIGPVGALKAAPLAYHRANQLATLAKTNRVDIAVLIDSWSFSKIIAAALKKKSPDTVRVKYIAPQVWASRPKRADDVRALFDGVLTLFSFEEAWFKGAAAKVCHVGNAIYQDAYDNKTDGVQFRKKNNIGNAPLLAIAPGSRAGELRRLVPIYGEALSLSLIHI